MTLQLPWIKRPDLLATPHDSGGWVVKDPLTLNYALLDDAEYTILNLLDGRTQFSRILAVLHLQFPDRQVRPEDLMGFIRALAGHQLIRQTVTGDSKRLHPETDSSGHLRLLQPLFQILRLQLPLFDPSLLLSSVLPFVSYFFRPLFWKLMTFVAVVALSIVILRIGDMRRELPSIQELLGPHNVATMLCVFVAVKILHEAGHAFTARYFGAECHECGVMLLVLTPVLYTNVTDAWVLPRRQRMLVTASGILVELSIAAVSTILWAMCAEGVTRSLLLNTMLLCSLNTLLFNGNPLLRFDGYFLLADWLGIPNLSGRGTAVLQAVLLQLFTGQRQTLLDVEVRKGTLLIYGILAACYRLVLTVAILQLIHHLTRQWHVEFLGGIVSISLIFGSLLMPVMRFCASVFSMLGSGTSGRMKVLWRSTVATVVICGFLVFPLPQTVVVPAFVRPTSKPVFSTLSGLIRPQVKYGEAVRSGDVVAVLENPELEKNLQLLKGRAEELQIQLNAMQRSPATANSELIPTLQEAVTAAVNRQNEFEAEFQNLVIFSSRNGTLLPPPATPIQNRSDLPGRWSGAAMDLQNQAAWIDRGTLLGYVGSVSELEVVACVGENEVATISEGQSARFHSRSVSGSFALNVDDVGQLEAEFLPMNLGVAGLIGGRSSESGIVPTTTTYFVTATLSGTNDALPPLYSVGQIRISTKPVSVATRLIRYLRQTF